VIRYGQHGRKASWNVKWYGKYGRKVSWIVKRYGKCRPMFSSYQKQALTVMISPLCTNGHDISVILNMEEK
jgi:hypothetical protein